MMEQRHGGGAAHVNFGIALTPYGKTARRGFKRKGCYSVFAKTRAEYFFVQYCDSNPLWHLHEYSVLLHAQEQLANLQMCEEGLRFTHAHTHTALSPQSVAFAGVPGHCVEDVADSSLPMLSDSWHSHPDTIPSPQLHSLDPNKQNVAEEVVPPLRPAPKESCGSHLGCSLSCSLEGKPASMF